MNREIESHFSMLPKVEVKRSKLKRPHTHKTAFNTGDLVPIYVDSDILPGDTVSMDMGEIIRMSTPITPVMDNAICDLTWFFVPHRLVWDHFAEFWGENNTTYWEQTTEYEIPQIEAPSGGWNVNSLADYMGLPIGIDGISVNHLPFRSYCKIINDWWRDENLKDPCMITKDETTLTGVNKGVGYDYVTDTELGAACYKAAKFHDYFTSALPQPQKGPSVGIPIGLTGEAPVIPSDVIEYDTYFKNGKRVHIGRWNNNNDDWDTDFTNNRYLAIDLPGDGTSTLGQAGTLSGGVGSAFINNFVADLSELPSTAGANATINELRQAIAVQEFYEAQARGGSRYIEFIKSIFGVTSPDARLQRSEYLGGTRFRVNMDQVLQTSSTDATSPQGNTAAFSCTTHSGNIFTHSFVEHGTLMCLAVIRTDHTYQQGIERMWNRKKWYDHYVPQFANLGEQKIALKELYAQGTSDDDETFGYQEAWADYRYKPSRISGELRSTYAQSLDIWHYGDNYTQRPYLSSEWIDEVENNVARTLAVTNEIQFIADFYFDATYVRPMPVYSIPAMLHM